MELNTTEISNLFKETIMGLQEEPDFQWSSDDVKYAINGKGEPRIQLAVGNVSLDYDLWEGLRNPAVVGLYPAGLQEIWEFYANRRKNRVDEHGRPTIFQTPRSYDYARNNYRRVVVISVMLPFSSKVIDAYANIIRGEKSGSSHLYARMYEDTNLMINKASSRVAMDLVARDRVVVAMDDKTVEDVSAEAIPVTHQGVSHGPSKGGNYSQKSVAALLGLGQFGIHRLVFRDEFIDGKVKRYFGPIRSLIIFDKEELVRNGRNGVIYPTREWREYLFKLYDFTNIEQDVNKYRFCSYIPLDDEGCGKCIGCCPSGAQPNSTSTPRGPFSEQVKQQTHRFWDGKLQFDYARCCEERGQMGTLFPEWSCTRCMSMCATEGSKRTYAAKEFYNKLKHLTKAE